MNTVFTKTFSAPDIDKGEILRYAGTRKATDEITILLDDCISEIEGLLTYKVCYAHFPLTVCQKCIDLSFTETDSKSLIKALSGCSSFVIFAATVGIETDRLISRYGRISPSRALMMQAIGSERIESLCNEFCHFAEKEYGHCTQRFSPGYGDLPIEIQKEFFRVLDPSRKIGLTLNESMLMTPSKSVTAIIGISEKSREEENNSCDDCSKTNCLYRRLK